MERGSTVVCEGQSNYLATVNLRSEQLTLLPSSCFFLFLYKSPLPPITGFPLPPKPAPSPSINRVLHHLSQSLSHPPQASSLFLYQLPPSSVTSSPTCITSVILILLHLCFSSISQPFPSVNSFSFQF